MKRKRREEEQEGRRAEPGLAARQDRQDRCLLGKSPGRMYISQNALPCSPLGLLGKSPGLSIWLNNAFRHGAAPSVVSLAGITFRKILTNGFPLSRIPLMVNWRSWAS